MELHTPKLYIPDQLPIMADYEMQQPEEIAPTVLQQLDNISSRATTLRQTMDIDSLLRVHHAAQLQKNQLRWHSIIVTFISTTEILGVLYFCLCPYLHHLLCTNPKPNDSIQASSPTTPDLRQQTSKLKEEKPEQTAVFTSYPTQHAD
jgi:hypothetical protein